MVNLLAHDLEILDSIPANSDWGVVEINMQVEISATQLGSIGCMQSLPAFYVLSTPIIEVILSCLK